MTRRFLIVLYMVFASLYAAGEVAADTILTSYGDKVILSYNVTNDGNRTSVQIAKPRIIPSDRLRSLCKQDLKRLKVVMFDKIGNYGDVKWSGGEPRAFRVPADLSCSQSVDGFYIAGENFTLTFDRRTAERTKIELPLYIAYYEKRKSYKICEAIGEPLTVWIGGSSTKQSRSAQAGTSTERVAVQTTVDVEGDNADLVQVASSINTIRRLLATQTEVPFTESLRAEMNSLRELKAKVRDRDILAKIDDVIMEADAKERELKAAQKAAEIRTQAALVAQQKQDEETQQKEAQEQEQLREEKQQKRTIWMIVGGIILAVLAFIGNAVFKHFSDLRNQKSIMQMQESLTRQAEHEAARRSREIVRNKTHQMANKGRNKVRESLQNANNRTTKPKRKTI